MLREPIGTGFAHQVRKRLAAEQVLEELAKAERAHLPMTGPHEGYAVILEELDELWHRVKRDHGRDGKARAEAIQIAAMAIRYVVDVCDEAPR